MNQQTENFNSNDEFLTEIADDFIQDAVQSFEDPLLDCLVTLTKLDHHPFSADALKAGLPLVKQRLTPELFDRAANRAGFKSTIVERKLRKIPSIVLPVILLLKNNQACVLESVDHDNHTATIIQPIAGKSSKIEISLAKLNSLYSGYAIFVKREYNFDSRTSEKILDTESKNWFWGTLWLSKDIYRDVLLASFFINLFVIATPLYVRSIYDRVIPNNALETLWVLSLGIAVVFLFEFIFKTMRGHFIDVAGKKADVILSAMIFEKVISIRMEARPESVGAFSDNVRAFETIKNFWTSATIAVFIDIPFFFLFIFVIYMFAGPMAYIPIFAVVLIVAYSFIIRIPIKSEIQKNFRTSLQKNATLIESLSSVETIKTLGSEGHIQRKWEEAVGYMADKGLKIRLLSQSVGNFSGFITNLSTIAIFIIGINQVINHDLSSGSLILCMMISRRAISPMSKVAGMVANYQLTKTALDSLNDIMQLPIERPKEKKFIHRKGFNGKIQFLNVDFNYPHQENKALSNISFTILPGQKVGFVGSIGSGKTTIEKLMLGLYQPINGQVRFDDVDMAQIDPADLRRNIGYVSQDIALFHGTVRDNICAKAPYVSDEEILRVANITGVTDFTNRHPAGFDMPVFERGEGLSGGQRQSICLARALLLDPPILILDEPTSSMDNKSEAMILNKLQKIVKDKTLVLVTHRSSVLKLVEHLIVIENASVAANGKKETVLEA